MSSGRIRASAVEVGWLSRLSEALRLVRRRRVLADGMKSNSTNGAEKRQYSIIASAKRNLEGQVNNGRGIGGASEQSNGKRAKSEY